MDWVEILNRARTRVIALGARRLAAIAIALTLVIAAGIFAAVRLGMPANQVLYSGLGKQDSAKIAVALRDANIPFDASADATTIYVPFGHAPRVRMLLARKGLPNSTSTGYELFDKIGSFGLTSFMQEITKLRATEGELSRTIQTINGVKSARVHIVMPTPNTFRRNQDPPSASVVLETEGLKANVPVAAIKHLIASALPGLKARHVTIVTAAGALLASPDDPQDTGRARTMLLEERISKQIRKNISGALSPYFSQGNFRVSVATRVDADRKNSVEKIFLPNTRVERSVRVVRETSDMKNRESAKPTTVKQNLPNQNKQSDAALGKTEATQKRSETTNYEISSRTTNVLYSGYQIKSISIAVVVNRRSLAGEMLDPKNAPKLKSHLSELQQVVEVAGGLDMKRGDRLKLAVIDFKQSPPSKKIAPHFADVFLANSGILLNGVFAVFITVLIIFLGVRPALKFVFAQSKEEDAETILISAPEVEGKGVEKLTYDEKIADPPVKEEMKSEDTRHRFKSMVESNEDDAVMILKQWIALDAA